MKNEMQEKRSWLNMLMLIQLLDLHATWMWVVLPNLKGRSCLHLYGQRWRWKQCVPIKMTNTGHIHILQRPKSWINFPSEVLWKSNICGSVFLVNSMRCCPLILCMCAQYFNSLSHPNLHLWSYRLDTNLTISGNIRTFYLTTSWRLHGTLIP